MTPPKYFPAIVELLPWVKAVEASPEPEWLVDGWLPAGGMSFIIGRAKHSKKSWLALALGMMIAAGRGAAGLKVAKARRVLFFSREGTAPPLAERFRRLENSLGLPLEELSLNFYHGFGGALYLDDDAGVEYLLKLCIMMKIDVIFLDTFARSFRGDENSVMDISKAMRGVEKLRDHGIATVLVHHERKAGHGSLGGRKDPDAGLRGSSALAGAYDILISLQNIKLDGVWSWIAQVGGKIQDFEINAYRISWSIPKAPLRADVTIEGPFTLPPEDEDAPEQKAKVE